MAKVYWMAYVQRKSEAPFEDTMDDYIEVAVKDGWQVHSFNLRVVEGSMSGAYILFEREDTGTTE